jgi:small subunit ribosomal protein S20
MPHRKSEFKTLKQDAKRRVRNRSVKSRLRTERNKFDRMIERGDVADATQQMSVLTKLIQRAATRNVIHANKAARMQAQFQNRLNAAG